MPEPSAAPDFGEHPIDETEIAETRTYTNPVYAGYMADPYVWRYKGVYYAVGTGALEASAHVAEAEEAAAQFNNPLRIFPLLHSQDFVTWESVGGALIPPDPALGNAFWAPEVAFHDGTFYLYYSVGHEERGHHLRVATSTHPMGPYVDSGKPLVDPRFNPFTIDAHAFEDDDGQWYLFYATDFLDTEGGVRAGTALVVDKLLNMTTLAGRPQTVLRARSDWQRFLADRPMHGGIYDWHTLEGPCVRKHEGKYYCFYSGGRYENDTYGVDYGVSDSVMGPYSDVGSEGGARILRSVAGHVIGPGHNSLVQGPNRQTDYLVYHAWNHEMSARQMCLDKLVWTPDGPRCDGPTWTPQTVHALKSWQSRL